MSTKYFSHGGAVRNYRLEQALPMFHGLSQAIQFNKFGNARASCICSLLSSSLDRRNTHLAIDSLAPDTELL